jgi:DNA recombination protein Rad52
MEDQTQREVDPNVKSTLFPDIKFLEVLLDGDWRDRPASEWAIKKSGTLQAKMERFRRDCAHKRSKFLSRDEIPMHNLIQFANESFGYDGWSTHVIETKVLTVKAKKDDNNILRHSLAIESTVGITLKDGTYHEGKGVGISRSLPEKSLAFSKAKKESITDGVKNCIQGFGELVLDHEDKMKKGYYTSNGLFQ